MGGHIRMDKDLEDDPRAARLAEIMVDDWISRGLPASLREDFLSQARNAVTGLLYRLWRYADTYLESGDVTQATVTQLADVTRCSVTVVTSLPPQWFRIRPDGAIELPGFTDKNSLITKDLRKENNRQRQARHRQKKRNERNALLSQESHGRNTSSRGRARAPVQAQPVPVPPNRTVEAALASAPAHLAQPKPQTSERQSKPNGKHPPPPTRTPEQLAEDARKLAATGLTTQEIARMLGQHGATLDQVAGWLTVPANKPAVAQ